MIDVPLRSFDKEYLDSIGPWLENNTPNPPMPEEQRWSLVIVGVGYGIRFHNDHDATVFALKWS